MPRTKGSAQLTRDEVAAMDAFHVGVDVLGTFSNEHKSYKNIKDYAGYKPSVTYGKKHSGFADMVTEIIDSPNFAGGIHFPKFIEYTKTDDFKNWKTGSDSVVSFQKNLALGTEALLVDVKAQYEKVRDSCDTNIDEFKRRLFDFGEKRERDDVKNANTRCATFKHRYHETRREMEMLAKACEDVGSYLGLIDQYYLHD
jgi:hypothetical protein